MVNAISRTILSFVEGWAAMILIGVLHAQVNPAIHTVDYWTGFVIALLVNMLQFSFQSEVLMNTEKK